MDQHGAEKFTNADYNPVNTQSFFRGVEQRLVASTDCIQHFYDARSGTIS